MPRGSDRKPIELQRQHISRRDHDRGHPVILVAVGQAVDWEGWLCLAAVQDVYSRRIVGWAMADHMRSELVVDALEMALAQRRLAPGLIHHSDQGSQYVSLAFGQQARAAGIARSII